MPKEGSIEFQGVVLELLPNAMFKVKLENDHEILELVSIRNKFIDSVLEELDKTVKKEEDK